MEPCKHTPLVRQSGTKFEFMTSYKEGKLPYICWDCGESFWVEPMVIRVLKPEASEAAAQPIDPWGIEKAIMDEIEHNDH